MQEAYKTTHTFLKCSGVVLKSSAFLLLAGNKPEKEADKKEEKKEEASYGQGG